MPRTTLVMSYLLRGWLSVLALAFCAGVALLPPANAAEDNNSKFSDVLGAVVSVRAEVPITARTADVLGTEREGSGVVIDDKGLILTIGYLILEASRAEVTVAGGHKIPVQILAYDHNSGFGLLRATKPLDVKPMKLGDSSALEESARVLISGFGGTDAVRPAIVVSRRVFAGYWEYLLDDAIFTSPPYENFGGAALIGPEGELLGIGSLVVGDAMGGDRAVPGNMFVPIDTLKPILKDMLANGRSTAPPRPWLGIYSEQHRGHVFVTRVADTGPAARAGIRANDLILELAGKPVTTIEDFYRKLWALGKAGIDVRLTVLRGADLLDITVRSGDRYNWLRLNPM